MCLVDAKNFREVLSQGCRDHASPADAPQEALPTIARRITELRKRRGLTQQQLAEKTGVTQARISHIEHTEADTYSLQTLKWVATALGVRMVITFEDIQEDR